MMNRVNINTKALRDELDRLARSALDSALNSLFNEIEKKLFIRAEHTTNQQDKSLLFEKIAQLKINRNSFDDTLYSVITDNKRTDKHINWAKIVPNRSLVLQIEDMITQAKAKYGKEHAQYESRIKSLNITDQNHFPNHLYTVSSITYGLVKATELFSVETQDSLIRLLGTNILYKLEPMYVLLNDLLIQSGVLPEFKSKRESNQSEIQSLIDAISDSESIIQTQLTEHTKISSEEIKDFLKLSVDNRDIFLQSKNAWTPKNLIEAIVERFRNSHTSLKYKEELNTDDQEIITLTGAMLADLINNSSINPIIKKQAIGLQTIILHTAFTDADFFSNQKNPARELLNKLLLLGTDPYLSTDDTSKITKAIKSFILSTSSASAPAFESLSASLDEIENSESHHAIAFNTHRSKLGDTVTTRCKNRVTFIINSAIGPAAISDAASTFLDKVLNPFMVFVLMNYGRQCDEWKESLTILDAIIEQEDSNIDSSRDTLIIDSKVKELINHPAFGDEFFKVAAQKTAIDHYFSHLKNKRTQLSLVQQRTEKERKADIPSNNNQRPPETTQEPTVKQMEPTEPKTTSENNTQQSHSPATQTSVEHVKLPKEQPTEGKEVVTDTPEPVEKTKQPEPVLDPVLESGPAPSSYERLYADPRIKQFLDRHIMNDEWLQIYTSAGAALRRLKASKINMERKIICFANRNGEITLALPIAQFISDLFENRSNPVFDNPNYNSAKQQLLDTIKSEGLL